MFQHSVNLRLCRIRHVAVFRYRIENETAAEVGRQNDNRVFKVYRPALRIGYSAVVEHLKQYIENVGVRLFYLVEKNDAIRFAPYSLGKLSALVIADVSRRCAYKTGNGKLFHILGHIYTNDILFVVKQILRQSLCKLRLTYACRAQEQERAYRSVFIGDFCSAPQDCFRHFIDRLVLTDDSFVKFIGKVEKFLLFAFHKFRYGNARPLCHYRRYLLRRHFVTEQLFLFVVAALFVGVFKFFVKFRKLAVLDFRRSGIIEITLCVFHFLSLFFDFGFYSLHARDAFLFGVPLRLHFFKLVFVLFKLVFKFGKTLDAQFIRLFRERHFLYLKLNYLSRYDVHFKRHTVYFRPYEGARLVHEVDCLVGQESIGYISV